MKDNFSYVGDTDGDGIKDDEDTDDDGDDVPDVDDAFPLDANESEDTDSDGTGNNADTDDDGDGVSDANELQNGTNPLLADTDEDGVNDDTDNCPTIANGVNEDDQADSDNNGIGDVCDSTGGNDADFDGVDDSVDNCPAVANGANEDNQSDIDTDQVGDACDPDIDGDGTANESDPCPNDEFDQCSTSTTDTDQDGVNDDLDPFPYDDSETADTDEDGLGDNQDDFPNLASEQFDTDGDGVGDNADLCPLVDSGSQGVNHNDADSDGLGDECDIDMSGAAGFWLLSADPDDTGSTELNDAGDTCVAITEIEPFYELVEIKQEGTQIWMHADQETFVGTIAANGNLELENLHGMENISITGNFDGSNFSALTYIETADTSDSSAICTETGVVAMAGADDSINEQTILQVAGGLSWFEADSYYDDTAQQEVKEFFYGSISDGALESMFFYNTETEAWETDAGESNNYLTSSGGIQSADDAFIVDGYLDTPATGETAIIKPTVSSLAVDYEIAHVNFAELDVSAKPIAAFLGEGFADGIADTDMFSSGARGYVTTIEAAVTSYMFRCDSDWDDWFVSNLDCNNVVSQDWVSDDPVPAQSFDDVIITPAEFVAMSGATQAKGIWTAGGNGSQIVGFLISDDGTTTGANAKVEFLRDYFNGYRFKVGEGSFASSTVGSTAILTISVPDAVRRLGDDRDDGGIFLFVDSDTYNGSVQNLVRRGEIIETGVVEHDLLFNGIAKEDILTAFALMPPLPEAFLTASSNGVDFTASTTITQNTSFGVADAGILREWDTQSGNEVIEYYVFDASLNAGRYVYSELDSSGTPVVTPVDEATTWSVNTDGNLEVTISSSGDLHQIALVEFSDTYRPQVVVLNPSNTTDINYSERMVPSGTFESEVVSRFDYTANTELEGSYTFINKDSSVTEVETMVFNSGGNWQWLIDGVEDESASWSLDPTTDYITIDFGGDADTVALETLDADANDLDADGDTSELVYGFTGWYEVDTTSGLGSFFRDGFYKN